MRRQPYFFNNLRYDETIYRIHIHRLSLPKRKISFPGSIHKCLASFQKELGEAEAVMESANDFNKNKLFHYPFLKVNDEQIKNISKIIGKDLTEDEIDNDDNGYDTNIFHADDIFRKSIYIKIGRAHV